MEPNLSVDQQMEDALSSWLQQTDCYLEATHHEDDQDGDVAREVLRSAGSRLMDGEIENLLYAISHLSDVLVGASDTRRHDNPALADELRNVAERASSAVLDFLMSDAGNAILTPE
ncbi:hypothetical protein [Kitasatospora sp. NRRL B-11411]|uniref:hypothetical protein n=1 Tax=Kitasatospora sp. NRRL B-11411 TaxID=1463822 RepID=UPI0012FE9D20|nr:hypothetical protein [Kitasatospora sp. NRRL B-11411]